MDNGWSNCPNCGAPVTRARCEYCGTLFFRLEDAICFFADGNLYARYGRQEAEHGQCAQITVTGKAEE